MLTINFRSKISLLIPSITCECGCVLTHADIVDSVNFYGVSHFVTFNATERNFACPCGASSVSGLNHNNNFMIFERFGNKLYEYRMNERRGCDE